MKRWNRDSWYPSGPKKPPPEHGIKMKKAGTTWWGQRWIEALEHVLGGDAGRLARGRTYARAGRTHDLVVKGGKVTAKVTGSRPTPYKITLELTQLSEGAWKKAIQGMADKAHFSAELLAGQMPKEIDEVFRGAGTSLFPQQRADLVTDCSCPDWGDPCKHVAATHYVLGEALDRDPFLLFELRGRTKEQVLEALRAARGTAGRATKNAGATPKPKAADVSEPEIPRVTLADIMAADYDKAPAPLPSLHFSFEPTVSHGAVMQQLGKPAAWSGQGTPADLLAPLVRAAAEKARGIALAEVAGERVENDAKVADSQSAQVSSEAPVERTKARKRPASRARRSRDMAR